MKVEMMEYCLVEYLVDLKAQNLVVLMVDWKEVLLVDL
jgi:hypothetical protein